MRHALLFGLMLAAATVARPLLAKTPPVAGAVSLPANANLLLPFPAGYKIDVLSGYGPGGGSSLHDGTNAPSKANDYYALDFGYQGEPNHGKGKPVVAPLGGQVIKAGWATAGWANYGLRIILRHDLGDGHTYHSIYAHLNAIDPSIKEGDSVAQGQTLGELGQSCQQQPSCGSFSTPHLHWALHRDSQVGGSGTGGSYGGNAVVPEPLDGAEDIVKGMVISSTNTGKVVCGDGFCNGDETHESCPGDCPICPPIPPEGRVVDESEPLCFAKFGTPDYWHAESAGHDGSLWWTNCTDDPQPDNYGVWQLGFDEAGAYVLEAYTAAGFAQATKAAYKIAHAGKQDVAPVDQSAVDGWSAVGTYDFAPGGEQSVRLDDNTGEPLGLKRKIAFDAIRLTRVGGGGGSGGAGTAGAGGEPGAGGQGAAPAGGGEPGAGGAAGSEPGGAVPNALGDEGCGCALAGRSDARAALARIGLLALCLGAAIGRRRRSRIR
ncbi:MAG: peptidoglycan DD-metalloendopeptidase family protein [Deltaproteobacteria bacterium]|nr:peptidoglycan DD-metalloendopeptidase family protein [Deltaproteobacteria bacterium]